MVSFWEYLKTSKISSEIKWPFFGSAVRGTRATENWIGEIAIQSSTNWMSPSYNFLFKEEGKVIMFSYLLMHNGSRLFLEWDCQFNEIWARPCLFWTRAISQTFWRLHCVTKSLFIEIETSNFGSSFVLSSPLNLWGQFYITSS